MIQYFSADYVIPITSMPIEKGIVAVQEGEILGVYSPQDFSLSVEVKQLSGVLIPGFINTHCHLELSHMIGEIPQKTGLVGFIGQVVQKRGNDIQKIKQSMLEADRSMFEQGIQAVGDHANQSVSAEVKESSEIIYHTFVEIIGLNDHEIQKKIEEAKEVELHFDANHSSITPHAPYSCSKNLFKTFKTSISDENIISIHNQESEEENKLFRYKTGDFLKFYQKIGYDLNLFKAQARNSIQSYFNYLPSNNRIILVHNTFTSLRDLDFISRMEKNVTLCLCPKANLYIENALPKVSLFESSNFDIALGTDSLASNDSLSILDELKVLHRHFTDLSFLETIKWATINGAKALGLDAILGSLEVGKRPGLVLLKNMSDLEITDEVKVERII